MSELRVDSVKSKGGGAPDLPKGVTISGITTAATLGATTVDVSNVNVSGVVTSGTLSGSLLSTGTPTLGLGVTINSSGVAISGVATAGIVSATTLYGDGTNLTGIGASIASLFYNPDISDSLVLVGTGIGITFNSQIKAGTGNITIRETNASGTVVENFGVGSSVTISENRVSFTPTAGLTTGTVYYLNYPSGCFTNNEGTDYVGTAYTFVVKPIYTNLWLWGNNGDGLIAQNNHNNGYSSPTQVPGTNYSSVATSWDTVHVIKNDGTFWGWGENSHGQMGQNSTTVSRYSSPVQIGSGTDWSKVFSCVYNGAAIKTDGSLWTMGYNTKGRSGQNNTTHYSSPVQVPGTWAMGTAGYNHIIATKTDGTLWAWGDGGYGVLAQNNGTEYSSPRQVGSDTTWGTTYNTLSATAKTSWSIKTDGTLWGWGSSTYGGLGNNSRTGRSSPIQIPGTDWKCISGCYESTLATRTDGTLWAWGHNRRGELGQNQGGTNNANKRSSPTQIPGTTWDIVRCGARYATATKTDGTLWAWGYNDNFGQLGQNNVTQYSSPVQVPGTWSLANVDLGISYTSAGLINT